MDATAFAESKDVYLRRALTNCELVKHDEVAACRFVVRTSWATMLMRSHPNRDGLMAASQLNEEAKEDIEYAREIYDPEWFEFLADAEAKPFLAAPRYRLGFWKDQIRGVHSLRTQTLVKWLGAMVAAGIPIPEPEIARIKAIAEGPRGWFRQNSAAPMSGLVGLRHVQDRWLAGGKELKRIWEQAI